MNDFPNPSSQHLRIKLDVFIKIPSGSDPATWDWQSRGAFLSSGDEKDDGDYRGNWSKRVLRVITCDTQYVLSVCVNQSWDPSSRVAVRCFNDLLSTWWNYGYKRISQKKVKKKSRYFLNTCSVLLDSYIR